MIKSASFGEYFLASQLREDRKVLVGKGGHLFLTNDNNRTIDQITGKFELRSDFREKWARLFRYRLEKYSARGVKCIFVIAPMKEAVYSECLPDGIEIVSSRRIVDVVISAGASAGMQTVYPLEDLRVLAKHRPAYPTGDTHWTGAAAYLAYAQTVRALGCEPIPEGKIVYKERCATGDLASKIGQMTVRHEADVGSPEAVLAFDNGVVGTGNLKCFTNERGQHRCVIFRDSFTVYLERMFAETFARTTLVWQPNVDPVIVAQEQPDIIISIIAERFLVSVPDDRNDPSNAALANAKLESSGCNGGLLLKDARSGSQKSW